MRRKKELIVVLSSLLVIVLSVSVAYFAAQIVGEGKQLSVNTANLRITYEESDGSLSGTNIAPPWSSTKTFKVTNSSNETYEYDIIIEDLVNTFVLNYLEYKITSTDGGYNMTEYKTVPKSASATNKVLAHSISIDEGDVHNYTIELRYIESDTDQSADMGKTLSGRIMISEGTTAPKTFVNQLLADNPTVYTVGGDGSPRADFATAYTANNTNTLFTTTATEDGSSVYYFAGNARNNWVKFGKEIRGTCSYNEVEVVNAWGVDSLPLYIKSVCESITKICTNGTNYFNVKDDNACTSRSGYEMISATPTWTQTETIDLYWRIIRTNEDGSIRLLYSGDGTADMPVDILDDYYTDYPFGYGYMYGEGTSITDWRLNTISSVYKQKIDGWYETGLNVEKDGTYTYDKYVSKTAIYCDDRATSDGKIDFSGSSGVQNSDSASDARLSAGKPSYKCGANTEGGLYETASIADKFSVSTTSGGNGDLTYPIALMTLDEAVFAGHTTSGDQGVYYIHNGDGSRIVGSVPDEERFIFMSKTTIANYYGSIDNLISSYGIVNDWSINLDDVIETDNLRPVLSLKSCVNWSDGNGSFADPYVVSIDATCAAAEN